MATRSFNYKKLTTTKALLEAASGLNSDDFVKLKIAPNEDNEIDVFELVSVLTKKWKVSRKAAGGDDNLDAQIIDIQLKREKLFKERIHNQTRLSYLIPKIEAQNRMIGLLSKLREMVQTFIRQTADDEMKGNIKPTKRGWVEYLTLKFNDLFDKMLTNEMEIKSWEEDGSTKILRTRLMQSETEKDIDDIILGQTEIIDGSSDG